MNELKQLSVKTTEITQAERWDVLKREGRFTELAAKVSCTPLIEQAKLGKDLESVLENKMRLPTIKEMIKYQGEDYTKIAITGYLNRLSSIGVVRNTLNDEENISNLVDQLIEKYPLWKLVEIRNVIKMAIQGEFGNVYDRVDPPTVFEWFNKYEFIRIGKIESIRLIEKSRYDSESMSKEMAGKLAKAFDAVIPLSSKEPTYKTKQYTNPQDFLDDSENSLIVDFWSDYYDELKKDPNHRFQPQIRTKHDYQIDQAIILIRKKMHQ